MKYTFSPRDLELFGYSATKEIEPNSELPYKIFSATTNAGLKNVEATFIYFKSDSKKSDVEKAANKTKGKNERYVIIPKSIGLNKKTIEQIFPKTVLTFIYEDLIWDKLYKSFSEYIDALKSSIVTEEYYVPPRKEDGDPKERLDDEIFEYLVGKRDISGKLIIICASAGVGKTTLARHLTVKLAERSKINRIIPTYVEASHWGKLKLESIEELWDIIENSIRNFSRKLTINEELFEHSLKQGYLTFIFDGFDELCSHRRSHFNPQETLQRLASIAEKSNAKIILTTRTLYWQTEIDEPPVNTSVLNLAPFNTQQAKGYYQKFFSKDMKLQNKALSFYKKLIKANIPPTSGGARVQFVNLPLCVGMIAEYVRLGGDEHLSPQSKKGLVRDILYQICEREKARKKLITDSELQLKAFEEIVIDQPKASIPEFDMEDLAIAGFDEADLKRLIDHPFVTTDDGIKYRFNYDFLPQYLRAYSIANEIATASKPLPEAMWKIMSQEANGKGFIVEHMLEFLNVDNLYQIGLCYRNIPAKCIEAKSFLFHLTKYIINQTPTFVTQDEKTAALLSVFNEDFVNNKEVRNLYIIGNIDGLNLSNVKFSNCSFLDICFTKCGANENTMFNSCSFSGELDFKNCDKNSWNKVKLIDCTLMPPSNLIWEEILGDSFGSKEEHIIDAMRLTLSKFWYHGKLKQSIRKQYWRKGSLGHSIYCNPLLKAMLKRKLIEEVRISGVSEGGYAFSRGSVADLQRFMDNRQLTGKIRDVYNTVFAEK